MSAAIERFIIYNLKAADQPGAVYWPDKTSDGTHVETAYRAAAATFDDASDALLP